MDVLCLIPARGGSKSVPRKNIRTVGGRPLMCWSIAQAKASALITRVIVSTDNPEFAEIARGWGADVPFLRPPELAGDLSGDIEFHRHALEWLSEHEDYTPDLVVNLRPTMPVRRVATIDRAITQFADDPEADSLRSVSLADQSPYKMWHLEADGTLAPVVTVPDMPEPYNQPRQLLPSIYWQNGYIDITRPRTVLERGSTTGRRIRAFIIDEPCADIDYEDEVAAAEALLAAMADPVPVQRQRQHPS